MDFNKARFNMIEQQIRTWNVLDQSVLNLLNVVKRENFVDPSLSESVFTDCDLPIRIDGQNTGEFMLSPKMEARLLQELDVGPTDKVLEIGSGTGHMAALLAQKAAHVTTIECNPALAELAERNLRNNHITRVKVVTGCAFALAKQLGEFDLILQSGSTDVVPESLLALLKPGGRYLGIAGRDPIYQAILAEKSKSGQIASTPLFETGPAPLKNGPKAPAFEF